MLIKDGKSIAVDARMLVSPINTPSSLHLVIGPYPEEDESHMTTEEGMAISIRPVKPEDAPLFTTFSKSLSQTGIYYRFFSPLKEVKPTMLARFTQIDYDREIALIALDGDPETERILGVARIIGDPDGKTGEFAVLVGNPWQGRGIATCLLKKCLLIARDRGFESIHGVVLMENKGMLELGKKLGFKLQQGDDPTELGLIIHFGSEALREMLAQA